MVLVAHHCSDVILPWTEEQVHRKGWDSWATDRHCPSNSNAGSGRVKSAAEKVNHKNKLIKGKGPRVQNKISLRKELSLWVWKAVLAKLMLHLKGLFLSSKDKATAGRTPTHAMSRITKRIYLEGRYSINVIAEILTRAWWMGVCRLKRPVFGNKWFSSSTSCATTSYIQTD